MDSVPGVNTTVDGWLDMINGAKNNISIAAFYVTLTQGARDWPPEAGGSLGLSVFNALVKAAKRGVNVRLVTGWPPLDESGYDDPAALEQAGVIVEKLNWPNATGLSGVLHSKFMLVDANQAYIGSANFDWRSLSQVKELGIIIKDCSSFVSDLGLIFEQYWYLGQGNTVPNQWPVDYWPVYNRLAPLLMQVDGHKVATYIAASPNSLCPSTRAYDAQAMLDVFRSANEYVRLSVMEYSPFFLFSQRTTIWPDLDNEMRLAALRGVKISFILAIWDHTDNATIPYLQSLDVLPNIEVRVMTIPPWTTRNGTKIPYTRVDHSKYAIAEGKVYITTSNWTPDYFLATAGVSVTMATNGASWRAMDATFQSDWNSQYTVPLFHKFPPLP